MWLLWWDPPKDTSLSKSVSFKLSTVKIRWGVWPVGELTERVTGTHTHTYTHTVTHTHTHTPKFIFCPCIALDRQLRNFAYRQWSIVVPDWLHRLGHNATWHRYFCTDDRPVKQKCIANCTNLLLKRSGCTSGREESVQPIIAVHVIESTLTAFISCIADTCSR